MKAKAVQLHCADDYVLSAREYAGGAAAAVVIASALGVPQGFYAAYATDLASRGYHVLTYDNRGFGDSARGPLRGAQVRLADWGRFDLEAALQRAAQFSPRRFLVGHSIGSQVLGLAPASLELDGAVLVAGTAPSAGRYPLRQRPPLWLLWHAMIPLLAAGRNAVPQRWLGLGDGPPLPAGAAADWGRWGRSRDYLFDPRHGLDLSLYAQIQAPLLAWNFADDPYAPAAAVEALLRQYPAAPIERRDARGLDTGSVGHFGFFRERQRDTLWRATAEWFDGVLAAPAFRACAPA
jgi:predicted alpha/beta hydrolase